MKQLFKYVRQEPGKVAVVTFLTALASAFRVGHSLIQVMVLNSLIKLSVHDFVKYVLFDVLVFALLSVVLVFQEIAQAWTIQHLSLHLRQDLARKISRQSIVQFQSRDTGAYSSWLTNDVNMIEGQGFEYLLSSIQVITDPLFSLIALLKFSWTYLPLIVVLSFFTVYFPQLVRKKLAQSNLSTTKANESLLNTINDVLRGFSNLMIFGAEREIERRITVATRNLIAKKITQAKYTAMANNIAGFSNIIGQTSIQAWTGYLALTHVVTVGVIASAGGLAYNVFNSLAVIAPILTSLRSLDPVFEKYDIGENAQLQSTREIANDQSLNLTAKKLQFSYKDKPVFKQALNFTIKNNEKVAIHGQSGSGKSTVLRILSGQLPNYQGSVELNQVELKDANYDSLRDLIAYIDQTPYLFAKSIRYNLTLGQDFDDEQLKQALKEADLLDYVNSLPEGLDTEIQEGGTSMSGGQKQRLALARGLLRKKKLFLLDESTSNLDHESALAVENNFLKQKDIAVVFVSHQLHEENLADFDQVIEV